VSIAITPERPTIDLIAQRFEPVPDGDKLAALTAHLDSPHCALALVFRRTTHKADRLAHDLRRRGYRVAVLHGRRTQGQREHVLSQLKMGALQALVATDIAARGLDIAGLTHVFNYDLPDTPETYVHRIGRTGRAGESGVAITLVAREDEDGVRSIERYLARRRGGPTGEHGEGRRTAHSSIRRDVTRMAAASPRDAGGQRPRPAHGEPARHAAAPTAQETTKAAPRSQRRRRRHRSPGPRPAATAS
jgi:superfamily II DNA/RNA helicase